MNIEIRKLTPELTDDFLDFFDNRAFTDNSPEGPCYCTRFQMTREQEKAESLQAGSPRIGSEEFVRMLREVAARQIESGVLQGYLAFVDGVSIGWCNANDRANFPAQSGNGARLYAPAEKREKVVTCFEIAPEFRGKGVATALLRRVIDDAKAEGYTAVEACPYQRRKRYEWDFQGPVRLYEKAGFTVLAKKAKLFEKNKAVTVRKELK